MRVTIVLSKAIVLTKARRVSVAITAKGHNVA